MLDVSEISYAQRFHNSRNVDQDETLPHPNSIEYSDGKFEENQV